MEIPKDILEKIKSLPKPVLIAVSGFGGSGKTTTAEVLGKELDAPVIGVDQFSKDRNQTNHTHWNSMDFDRLKREVLIPFQTGESSIRYGHYDWAANTVVKTVEVPHDGTLILEGVGLFRPELNQYFSYKIWVDTPQEEAIARGKKRDREVHQNPQDERWDGVWKQNDVEYVRDFNPKETADVILSNI